MTPGYIGSPSNTASPCPGGRRRGKAEVGAPCPSVRQHPASRRAPRSSPLAAQHAPRSPPSALSAVLSTAPADSVSSPTRPAGIVLGAMSARYLRRSAATRRRPQVIEPPAASAALSAMALPSGRPSPSTRATVDDPGRRRRPATPAALPRRPAHDLGPRPSASAVDARSQARAPAPCARRCGSPISSRWCRTAAGSGCPKRSRTRRLPVSRPPPPRRRARTSVKGLQLRSARLRAAAALSPDHRVVRAP